MGRFLNGGGLAEVPRYLTNKLWAESRPTLQIKLSHRSLWAVIRLHIPIFIFTNLSGVGLVDLSLYNGTKHYNYMISRSGKNRQ